MTKFYSFRPSSFRKIASTLFALLIAVAGISQNHTLEGYVFNDRDNNTLFNGSDLKQGAVKIYLYEDNNSNGTLESSDLLIDSATSNAVGDYAFTSVASGNYLLELNSADLPPNGSITTNALLSVTLSGNGSTQTGLHFGFSGSSVGCVAWAASGDLLYTFNRFSNTNAEATSQSNASNIQAMAYGINDKILWAVNNVPQNNRLGRINTETGQFTALASSFGTADGTNGLVTLDSVYGISFDYATGTLYAVASHSPNNVLFAIDTITGAHINDFFGAGNDYLAIEQIFSTAQEVDDISFDPITGKLYGLVQDAGSGQNGIFVTIDITTGDVDTVGLTNYDNLEGLTFAIGGSFFGTSGLSGQQPNSLFSIDATNGTTTFETSFSGSGTDFESCACFTPESNASPVAVNDNFNVPEDQTTVLNVQLNDSDPDGDALTTSIISGPQQGNATVLNGDSISYTPNTNFTGLDTIEYEVCDGNGACDNAFVYINVGGVNDLPVALDDAVNTNEDTYVVATVLDNDSDPDGDPLTISIVMQPSNGSATVLNGDSIGYQPNANFSGTDTLSYRACDGSSGCDTAFLVIAVNPINDAPVAMNDAATTPEETQVGITVLDNDNDPDGDVLTTGIATGPANGLASFSNDTLYYTPNTNFNGSDTITYSICDPSNVCDTAMVIVQVNGVNDAPIATNDNASTNENQSVIITVLDNDTDPDGDALNISIVTPPQIGSVNVLNGDSISYTPNTNVNGLDSLQYRVCDGSGGCDSAWVFITINSTNNAPTALDDNLTTNEDQAAVVTVQENDTDPDNDVLTTSVVTNPIHGTATVLNGDSILYDPDVNYNGADSMEYAVCDPFGLCDTAMAYFQVNAINDAPIAADDAATTNEDEAINVLVLANDTDADNDPLTVGIVTPAVNGSTQILNGDSVQYTPSGNYNGLDSFAYRSCDGFGACDTAWAFITILSVNDAPVGMADYDTTGQGFSTTVLPLLNDFDIENDSLILGGIVAQPSNGVAVATNDSIVYTPAPGFNGSDTIVYQVCDTNNACDTALVIIQVDGDNDAPVAVNDSVTTNEDNPVGIKPKTNDSDPENDPLALYIIDQPDHGVVTVQNFDSTFYDPAPNYFGLDSFQYAVCDAGGLCDSAWVFITINSVNDSVEANADIAFTQEETTVVIDVLENDVDADMDTLTTIAIINAPNDGTAIILNGDSIQYTPNTNFTGTDSLRYRVCDLSGSCDSAWVIINVFGVNDQPIAVDDTATTVEDSTIVVDVQANDLDPDGDQLFTSVSTPPTNGVALVIDLDSISYTPGLNYNGLDSFQYQICDGNLCDQAWVYITISAVNDAPIALNDNDLTPENTATVVDVQANDSDPDGDVLTTSIVSGPNDGSASVLNGDSISYTPDVGFQGSDTVFYSVCDPGGLCDTARLVIRVDNLNFFPIANDDQATTLEDVSVTIDVQANDNEPVLALMITSITQQPANGTATVVNFDSITYTPDANFFGLDTFYYQVCNPNPLCDTAMVIVNVLPVNDVPVAVDDNVAVLEDSSLVIDVQANDSDIEGHTLTTTILVQPTIGSANTQNGDSVFYVPNSNANGPDSLLYQICDGNGGCDTAWVFINVIPVNDAPVAMDDSESTNEDTPIVSDVQANDFDVDGDVLTTTIATGPQNGLAVVLNGDSINYTPNANFFGTDTVLYSVCDPSGACDTAMLVIQVGSVNDCPVAVNDIVLGLENTPQVIDVQANDSEPDGDPLSTTIISAPSNGTVAVLNGDSVSYDPDQFFAGVDNFTYRICDGNGCCDTATVTITIVGINNDPIAVDDNVSTLEDQSVVIDVQANDFDPEGLLLLTSITQNPTNGSVTVINLDSVLYDPNPNFNGADTFFYQVCDPTLNCATARVIVNVIPVNDAPIAVDDSVTVEEDASIVVDVQANDVEVDGNILTTSLSTSPQNGTANIIAGDSILYTPNSNYFGLDSLQYEVCDGSNVCDDAWVYITVTPVNDEPIAINDVVSTNEDVSLVIDVQANDTDVDNDPLATSIVSGPSNGTVNVLNGDSIQYDPANNFNGNDTFQYSICDPSGLCDTAFVFIQVNPINDAPVAVNDSAFTVEDTPLFIDVQINDNDPDGTTLNTSISIGAQNGTAAVSNGDSIYYVPNNDFFGLDSLRYEICDAQGACDQAWVFITVAPENDSPVAVIDLFAVTEDTPTLLNVVENDFDPDNDSIAVTAIVVAPVNGTASIAGDSTILYSPDLNYNGTDSLEYVLCDTAGACDTARVIIVVTEVNDTPVANDDSVSTQEDTPVSIAVKANDFDVDGDSLSVIIITPSTQGVTSIFNGVVTYSPQINYVGLDSFQYEVCDDDGACDDAWVYINMLPVNDSPVALDDFLTMPMNTIESVDVQGNDSDPEGDALTTTIVTGPSNGSATVPLGTNILYQPTTNYVGPDSIRYRVCDPSNDCDEAWLYINVLLVNTAPVAADDSASTPLNTAVEVDVTANDFDVNNHTVTLIQIDDEPNHGTVSIISSSEIEYTPNQDYEGWDTLVYEACDGFGGCDRANVYIEVVYTPLPPVAVDDEANTLENEAVVIDILDNDVDPNGFDLDSVTVMALPVNGTVTVQGDRSLLYTPNEDFYGEDQLTYRVCNERGLCDDAEVFITVVEPFPIIIPEGLSPNGDGFNDRFIVDGLSNYPINEFTVYNRWGDIVYEVDDYGNDWDGRNASGEPLPEGTYFYLLTLGPDDIKYRGFIDLRR